MPKRFYTVILQNTCPCSEFFSLFGSLYGDNDEVSGADTGDLAGRYALVDSRLKVSADSAIIDILDNV